MKAILFLVISFLALHNVKGAPRNAVYRFVRCNPGGDLANCVIHQSREMEWSRDLPTKLSAAAAQYLGAKLVEEESAPREELMISEEEKSPGFILSGDGSGGSGGSGGYEGSATYAMAEDQPFVSAESESGSGESWAERDMDIKKGRNMMGMKRFFYAAKSAEQELKEDQFLKL